MKKQESLALDMARLAEFWYKSACINDNMNGAKYAMELAIKASQEVARCNGKNLHLDAFLKFLEEI